MRIGVIGLGRMGRHHVRNLHCLQKEGLLELVAVSDTDTSKKELADSHGCEFYTDYKIMISKCKLDAVTIVVPTSLHDSITMDCLKKGINVLVEKPISHSLQSANRMIKTAKENKVQLMVGHVERFNPIIQKLKSLIEEHALGEIMSLGTKRLGMPRISDAGVILDLAIHDIDIMLYLLKQNVSKVYAVAQNKITPNNLEDYANIILQFEKGAIGVIESSRLIPSKVRELFVTGTKSYCRVDYIHQNIELIESFLKTNNYSWGDFQEFLGNFSPKTTKIKEKSKEPLYLELKSFVSAVKNNMPVPASGYEAVSALKVALAAIESYKTGKIVTI